MASGKETTEHRRERGARDRLHARVRRRAKEYEDAESLGGVYDRISYLANSGKFNELITHPLWDEILERMVKRESAHAIERWLRPKLQEGEPLYGVSTEALIRRLQRLRKSLPEGALVPMLEIDRQHYHDSRLDVMREFAGMIRYQKSRVDRFAEAEKEFPIPVEQQRRELETLSEMLKQYWQAEVGLGLRPGAGSAPAAQTNVNVAIQNKVGELGEVGQAMALTMREEPNAIPEVMGLLDRLRQGETIEGEAVEVDVES